MTNLSLFLVPEDPETPPDFLALELHLNLDWTCVSRVEQRTASVLETLANAVALSQSEWIAIVPERRLPSAALLREQWQECGDYDACFPFGDPLIYEHASWVSLIPGTLFRRSVLERVLRQDLANEFDFWRQFPRVGTIGGIPQGSPNCMGPSPDSLFSRSWNHMLRALVDAEWYLAENRDVAATGMDAADHYNRFGAAEGRNPNPWFDTAWYLEQNSDARSAPSPLHHFVILGAERGRQPHPDFYLRWYSKRYLGTPYLNAGILLHFLTTGATERAVPDPRLDTVAVALTLAAVPAEQWFSECRQLQAVLPSHREILASLVDADWYLNRYEDVRRAAADPVSHYLLYGSREGRDAGPWFRASWYQFRYAGAAESHTTPLVHFINTGAALGLRPCPEFDTVWYSQRYLGAKSPSILALWHFLTSGLQGGAVPDPRLDNQNTVDLLSQLPVASRFRAIQEALGTGTSFPSY